MKTLDDYKQAAEMIYPGLGAWTYEKFDEFNKRHFNETIPLMPIQWHGTLPYGATVGLAHLERQGIGKIYLGMYKHKDLNLKNGEPCLYGEHVLLHEMIHHYLFIRGEGFQHNSESWRREIMRVGREIGLKFNALPEKIIKVKDANGKRKSKRVTQKGSITQSQIASFPHFAFIYPSGRIKSNYILLEVDKAA